MSKNSNNNNNLPNICIVGLGEWATSLILGYKSAGFKVSAIVGKTLAHAKELAQKHNISIATTIDLFETEILTNSSIDLISISLSPSTEDKELFNKISGAKKHLILEKNYVRGNELNQYLAEIKSKEFHKNNKLGLYNLQFRSLTAVRAARKLISQGKIGVLTLITGDIFAGNAIEAPFYWFHDKEIGGGVYRAIGATHFTDIATFIAYASIHSVSMNSFQIKEFRNSGEQKQQVTADEISLSTTTLLRRSKQEGFPVTIPFSLRLSLGSDYPLNRLYFHGTKGLFTVNLDNLSLTFTPLSSQVGFYASNKNKAKEEVLIASPAEIRGEIFSQAFNFYAQYLADYFTANGNANLNINSDGVLVDFTNGYVLSKLQDSGVKSSELGGKTVPLE